MEKKINGKDDITLTRAEVKRIEKALKDPEFHKYWKDYLDELTDPAGRKEREDYMLEQQKSNDLPPNTILVRPEALMCLKTYTRRILSGQNAKKYVDQKLFINVCTSPHMDPPEQVEVMHNGQKMQNWSLPYTLSKPRAGKDSKGEICMTVDIIFNTKCKASTRFEEFKKMLCDTAIDAVNTYMKEYNEKASQNYKLLKKMKYKGGEPEFILMKKRDKTEGKSALSENLKTDSHLPQAIKEIYDVKDKSQTKEKEKKDEEPEIDVDVSAQEAIKEQHKKKRRIKAHNEEPKYTITESRPIDYGECFDGPSLDTNGMPQKKIPQSLIIRIELPGVRTTKNAKLEIQEKRLKFAYLENYILDTALPYYVNEKAAKAKYDKDKEVLIIEVEVDKTKHKEKSEEKSEQNSIVDLTNIGKNAKNTEKKQEETVEVEKIEIPSLFNIYKPPTTTNPEKQNTKNNDKKPEDALPEIKYKSEPEPEFLPNTNENKENNNKTLITEVKDLPEKEKNEPKLQEMPVDVMSVQKIEGKYDFKQLGEFVILTYKIKGYKKDTVTHILNNNEILLEVFDPNLKAIQRTCVTLRNPIVAEQSTFDLLVDFICIKLKKADPSKTWDQLGYNISQLAEPIKKPEEIKKEENKNLEIIKKDESQNIEKKAEIEDRQENLEKIENQLEMKEKKINFQYVNLQSPMIFNIY